MGLWPEGVNASLLSLRKGLACAFLLTGVLLTFDIHVNVFR